MDKEHIEESRFQRMPEKIYTRRAQIPISSDRFNYLVNEYKPKTNDLYAMFHHSGHFMIYDNTSKYCLFDAAYLYLNSYFPEEEDKEALVAVISEITINQDETQWLSSQNDFSLLSDIILKIL